MFKIDPFVSVSAIKSVSSINADDKICLHIPLTLSVHYWIILYLNRRQRMHVWFDFDFKFLIQKMTGIWRQ